MHALSGAMHYADLRMCPVSDRTPGLEAEDVPRPFLPWLGRACRQAREERGVLQVQIAAAMRVNQATVARFEDGTAWPRRPEDVLLAYATELGMDVRLLWLHGFVLWIENEPVLDEQAQAEIRGALRRLAPPAGAD
jgi:transcriptional regulator with XRE-family HTH domain